ncbi:MAG: DHA2 family efflux MFS transporter permease subunit [Sciscionella sp.]
MNARHTNQWAALSALCIGFFMVLLDQTIVMVAIPSMISGLHASLNSVVWVTSVYLLTYAVPILFASRLGDRFGPKRLFLIGLFVFTASSLWCGLSGTAEMLIAARAVQGLGAAAMTPQTLAFITNLFPGGKRGAAMGMWGGVAGLATITGPLLGGLLVDNLGWEWIFFINVPIGVVGFILALILVPDWQPRHSHKFDIPGILLSAAGLFCLIFGIQNGQQYHWGTVTGFVTIPMIIGAGVLLLAIFVIWQRFNRKEPLLPLRIFRGRNFSTGNLANITLGFALGGMFIPIIIYLQSVLGMSPLASGVLTAPMSLMSGMIAPFIGRASDRFNPKYLVMTGLLALALGLGILAWQAGPYSQPWSLIGGLLVTGAGLGFVFSPLTNLTTRGVEPRLMGTASGIFNTSRQLGAVFGAAAIGVLLQARIATSLHDAATQRAAGLPAQFRQQFIAGFSQSSGSASEFGAGSAAPHLPPGIPAGIAAHIRQLGTDAFHAGFTDAVKTTMILPICVLLLGALACILIKWRSQSAAVAMNDTTTTHDTETARDDHLVHGTVLGHGGAPLAGAVLTLIGPDGEQVQRGSATADGSYTLHPPTAAGYVLITSAPAYRPQASNVSVNGEPVHHDVRLTAAGGISGTVRSAGDGAAILAASVTVTDSGGDVVTSQLSGDDGGYHLETLPPGDYTLVVGAPGHQPLARALPVAETGQRVEDIELRTASRLHGVISAGSGRTIREAMVAVIDTAGHVVRTAMSDDAGEYTMTDLPDGDYTVIASGYPPRADSLRLAAGEQRVHDLRLDHASTEAAQADLTEEVTSGAGH